MAFNEQDKKTDTTWDFIVENWDEFNNSGHNIHRDFLNLPRFLDALPENKQNTIGLEVGGGEGTLVRILTKKGYDIISTDFSPNMIKLAIEKEKKENLGIKFAIENAESLSFNDKTFDYAISFMCLMDMIHPELAFKEIFRVLKPGGFLQFSIVHPCFGSPPHHKHVKDEKGEKIALEVGRYNEEGLVNVKWTFPQKEKEPFHTFHHHLTLSHWIMLTLSAGFQLEYIAEPYADEQIIEACPHLKHTVTVPDNLLVRVRKPK